jgi:hypothetical protein
VNDEQGRLGKLCWTRRDGECEQVDLAGARDLQALADAIESPHGLLIVQIERLDGVSAPAPAGPSFLIKAVATVDHDPLEPPWTGT